jgi:hypothetical protein
MLLCLGTELQFLNMVYDLTQIVAALNPVLFFAEDFAVAGASFMVITNGAGPESIGAKTDNIVLISQTKAPVSKTMLLTSD